MSERMTAEELSAIEARAIEYMDSEEFIAGWYPDDMANMVAEVRALRELAGELAEALDRVVCCSVDWPQSSA